MQQKFHETLKNVVLHINVKKLLSTNRQGNDPNTNKNYK